MNQALAWWFFSRNIKKYIATVLLAIVLIISLPIMAVFSLGGDALSFLSGSSSAVSAAEQGFYMGLPAPGDTYAWGNCTYWAYAMRYWNHDTIPTSWGNADTWDDNARADGYAVDHTPSAGAVFQTDEGSLGHVAYVTSVDATTGEWKISEMNAPHFNVVSTRTFKSDSGAYYNFIHDKKVAP